MKWLIKNKLFPLLLCALSLYSHTIEEKEKHFFVQEEEKERCRYFTEINTQLRQLRKQMAEKYTQAYEYYKENAKEEEYYKLLNEVRTIRFEIQSLEKQWHELAVTDEKKEDEGYALWDQDAINLSHLVMEYGSSDYLYVIPPEVFSMTFHLHSGVPIPRESWSELLEVILSHNGVGVKQLNPYTRQLYVLKQDLITVDQILSSPKDLAYIPAHARIAYIFSPFPEHVKEVFQFFDRFRDPKITFIYQVGCKIALISSKDEVAKLLALYEAIWEKERGKFTKVLSLSRIHPEEMEKIIKAYFGNLPYKSHIGSIKDAENELIIFPLKSEASLVLIGNKDLIERAEKIVKETENQVEDPTEMTLFLYTCRHSNPVDMAEVLEKVYTSLIYSEIEGQYIPSAPVATPPPPPEAASAPPSYARMVVPPVATQKEKIISTTHFIPYLKTGSIMMVVRRDTLSKIKELIQKIDVPKKMVRIEVLLFEKRMKNNNNFGLNILRLGSAAQNIHTTGARYETGPGAHHRGIFDFFLSRKKTDHSWPAFDIAYNFLMAQEDIHINAAPSITTLNQTPAQIALVEEISIDMGAAPVDTRKGTTYLPQFVRSQYGTTLTITPTVHEPDLCEKKHFITLETNINFDTIKKTTHTDRPPVSRRRIENHVRVVNGEVVILGGLREKTSEETTNKLPFLGDIPGIGKFFSDSHMTDERTEIFVFITPHILFDGREQIEQLRYEQLLKRPGDLPEFVQRVQEAKERKREHLFTNSLKLFFGHADG